MIIKTKTIIKRALKGFQVNHDLFQLQWSDYGQNWMYTNIGIQSSQDASGYSCYLQHTLHVEMYIKVIFKALLSLLYTTFCYYLFGFFCFISDFNEDIDIVLYVRLNCFRHVQNWFKHAQSCQTQFKNVQIGTNMPNITKLFNICSKIFKLVQTHPNLSKFVQITNQIRLI